MARISLISQVPSWSHYDSCYCELFSALILTPDDIDWALNPRSTFKPHDGEALSYADYFLRAYNKRISDLNQPLLVSRMKKKEKKMKSSNSTHDTLHLIPELCTLTGTGEWGFG